MLESALEAASFLAEDIIVTSVSDRNAMQRLFQTSVRMQRMVSDKSNVPLDNVPPLTEWHNLLHQGRYFEAASIADSSAVTRFSQQMLQTLLQVSGPDSQEMGGGDKSPPLP